jgi:3,4-dihydroxy 2-butanone 4-phosphate synthase/GTP cyclohydrolase II
MSVEFSKLEDILTDLKAGKPVILVDNEDRENEGDLVLAAEKATIESINFIIKEARGLMCTPLTKEIAERLNLPMMVEKNTDPHTTAFTVSIDANENTTTGISASDRYYTVQKLADPSSVATDFRRPGHIFPLVAKEGGVLVRAGHTEGSVDLLKMAGLKPVAVICEILKDDGDMARVPDLLEMAKKFNIRIYSIEKLIEERRKSEKLVEKISEAKMPTKYGDFKILIYKNTLNEELHPVIMKGELSKSDEVMVRVHSECLTGDVLGSLRCDCGAQLHQAMQMIEKEGKGLILYLRQEGRGIGIGNKIKAYHLQDKGMDTVEANLALGFPEDLRDYGIGAQIIKDIGVQKIKLMTNNPKKMIALKGYGLEIVSRIPIIIEPGKENRFYLETKKNKMGHILDEK